MIMVLINICIIFINDFNVNNLSKKFALQIRNTNNSKLAISVFCGLVY